MGKKEITDYRQITKRDSPFLGSWDLDPDKDTEVEISGFREDKAVNPATFAEDSVLVLEFKGAVKGMVVNATNGETISRLAGGSRNPKSWVGLKINLYVDQNVKQKGGGKGPGIRVRA